MPTAEHGCPDSDVDLQLPRTETLSRFSEVLTLLTWCYAGIELLKSPGPIAEADILCPQSDRAVVFTKICMEPLVIIWIHGTRRLPQKFPCIHQSRSFVAYLLLLPLIKHICMRTRSRTDDNGDKSRLPRP